MRCGAVVLLILLLLSSVHGEDQWVDEFDEFSLARWTPQTSGLQLVNMAPPTGVDAADGTLTIFEALRGVRLTSRDRFLYGTLEARIRISPKGLQYVGFMSRSPWGANTAMCMSMPTAHGWEMMLSRDKQGGHAGFGCRVEDGQWAVLKIDWRREKISLDVDGQRIGEILGADKIPQTPLPLILDAYATNRLELDWLRITDTSIVRSSHAAPPAAPETGATLELASDHWQLAVDSTSGIATTLVQTYPQLQPWTPGGTAAVDVYIKEFDASQTVRFKGLSAALLDSQRITSRLQTEEMSWRGKMAAEIQYALVDQDLEIQVDFTALENLQSPVEIGLGIPFYPEHWERNAIPRLPWLALDPQQPNPVRLPFLASAEDATVTSDTGNWVHYPFGILQNESTSVFWGNMDLGQRTVLAPGNFGSGPAVTLAPKTWAAGEAKRLVLRLRAFPRATTEVLRWYLSHCVSSDPLTQDLFPVQDWSARTLPDGGGLGMPDLRVTRVNQSADPVYTDRITTMLRKYHMTNLWFGVWHHINGSYPTQGEWLTTIGLEVSAASIKAEVGRLKKLGLRPCLYTFQFITPEMNGSHTIPSRDWVLHDILGDRVQFDSYRAGDQRSGAQWFTKELAAKVGSPVLTWADVDFGRKDVREFYFKSITTALHYYEPAGICFDYGWGVLASNATHSPSNSATSQPHGRLRVQADIYQWIQQHHPEMLVIINDNPGTPSQLFTNCQLVESSDVMTDLDLEAGRALGSAMSSMDYFTDHDELRWSRQVMSDLSYGCSIGLPFWIPLNGPDDYVNSWQAFYDFSGRTTELPIVASSTAITSNAGRSVNGTVWASDDRLMAVAMDRRNVGKARPVVLSIQPSDRWSSECDWRVVRLSRRVQPIIEHGWRQVTRGQLVFQGSLRPGEMIMIEPQP
ncbi:MAG: hypothetical protein MK165_04925 [Pirellulaceae bacterium]|nr:hypothetical protein [Pirellulaceae bacterium]